MSRRLLEVDSLALPDHYYLDSGDTCYYAGDYTAGESYGFSETNQLIYNLKKPVSRINHPDWKYKERAIDKAAAMFRAALNKDLALTLVPIPPSKKRGDPDHDDRMLRLAKKVAVDRPYDTRELVVQTSSIPAVHCSDRRPKPEDLVAIYKFDELLARPFPTHIFIVDDVLTTGCHFKAVKQILSKEFSDAAIYGLFVARRVPRSAIITVDSFE